MAVNVTIVGPADVTIGPDGSGGAVVATSGSTVDLATYAANIIGMGAADLKGYLIVINKGKEPA